MRGQIQHRSPQTTAELQRAYGGVPRDADIDRGATPRVAQVHYSDHEALDRTELIDSATYVLRVGAAGAECARSHCRPRARSSRLAGRAARCGRTPRADLACGVRRRTN